MKRAVKALNDNPKPKPAWGKDFILNSCCMHDLIAMISRGAHDVGLDARLRALVQALTHPPALSALIGNSRWPIADVVCQDNTKAQVQRSKGPRQESMFALEGLVLRSLARALDDPEPSATAKLRPGRSISSTSRAICTVQAGFLMWIFLQNALCGNDGAVHLNLRYIPNHGYWSAGQWYNPQLSALHSEPLD